MPTATCVGRMFSVVTSLSRVVGHTWDIAGRNGLARACAGIHACEIPVVEPETEPLARVTITGARRRVPAI
jgi:allantoin racemase